MDIITAEQVTPDTGKFVSDRGTEFTVAVRPNGLFYIRMKKGGVAPPMCDEHFTSQLLAETVLSRYIAEGDRLGNAVHPGKTANNA